MQFTTDFETGVTLPAADSQWVNSLHAVSGDRVILSCATAERFEVRDWLVDLTRDGTQTMEIPPELRTVASSDEDEDPQNAYAVFTLGDMIGILQSDERIHLFDKMNAKPRTIVITNPFPQVKDTALDRIASFVPIRCGKAHGDVVPVVFLRPTEPKDYACYYSLLEIDLAAGSARWMAVNEKKKSPVHIKYERTEAKFRDTFHLGPILHDLAWDGKHITAWAIGEKEHIDRWGMSYCALLESAANGAKAKLGADVPGECYGKLLQPERYAILTPRSQAAPRKGKQSLLNLESLQEEALELPRGMSTARVLDGADGTYWAVSRAKWLNIKSAVPAKEGEPFIVVALKAT